MLLLLEFESTPLDNVDGNDFKRRQWTLTLGELSPHEEAVRTSHTFLPPYRIADRIRYWIDFEFDYGGQNDNRA